MKITDMTPATCPAAMFGGLARRAVFRFADKDEPSGGAVCMKTDDDGYTNLETGEAWTGVDARNPIAVVYEAELVLRRRS